MMTTTYAVDGLTGGSGVVVLTRHLSVLEGVLGVCVDFAEMGPPLVRVISNKAVCVVSVRAAIREAGYELHADRSAA